MIKLSKKEQEIADLLCTGLMQKEIAAMLGISEKTVATHRNSILKKKGKASIKELMYDIIVELRDKIRRLEKMNEGLKIYKQRWDYLVERELLRRER